MRLLSQIPLEEKTLSSKSFHMKVEGPLPVKASAPEYSNSWLSNQTASLKVGVLVTVGVAVEVRVLVSVAVFVGVRVSVTVGLAVGVGVSVSVSVTVGVGETVGESVMVGVGEIVGVSVTVGVFAMVKVGVAVAEADGAPGAAGETEIGLVHPPPNARKPRIIKKLVPQKSPNGLFTPVFTYLFP
jgi:hypothetical protein